MTNNDSRATQKTGFINNTKFTYNESLVSDFATFNQVQIDSGVSVINTLIDFADYHTAPYIVLKQSVISLDFVVADNPGMITSYNHTVNNITTAKIRITLPTDKKVPFPGQWTITLYNNREAERQSISKVLKPRADL
jgi:hypothetical protein